MAKIEYFKLPKTGDLIQAIGFGSGSKWRVHKWGLAEKDLDQDHFVEELSTIVKDSIDIGMVHIDTAELYTTREEVGLGIKNSGKPRSEIFLTDKWSPGFRGSKLGPYEVLQNALKDLKLDYLDLYLIHSPRCENAGLTLEEAWSQMIKLQKDGLTKNIGVSNFGVAELKKIADFELKPQVNQVEFHAYLQTQSPGLIKYCKENDILVEAYGPLAPIVACDEGPLDPILEELSKKYQRSKSQILLRWVYQNGILPITTSSKLDRLKDALRIFEFELDEADFQLITKVGREKLFRKSAKDLFGKYDDVLYQDF